MQLRKKNYEYLSEVQGNREKNKVRGYYPGYLPVISTLPVSTQVDQ